MFGFRIDKMSLVRKGQWGILHKSLDGDGFGFYRKIRSYRFLDEYGLD